MRIAVIDTGTNSTRVLVADALMDKVVEVYRQSRVTRLGEGVEREGNLDLEARNRVVSCFEEFATHIRSLGVSRTMVLATSSVREACDGMDFLHSLAEDNGFESKLLSGDEEAALSFSGAATGLADKGSVHLFDVGGGSTEVVFGYDGGIVFARSLRFGCVRLTERFISSDPVSQKELEAAGAFIDLTLKQEIDEDITKHPQRTIAVAGTATSLAAIDMELKIYDRSRVHGYIMNLTRIQALLDELSGMSLRQRLLFPTMEPGRADVIVAGTLILERLMLHTGADELVISELDILDGAALAMSEGKL